MSYMPSAIRAARGANQTRLVWAHPAKNLNPGHARTLWRALSDSPYVPSPLHTYELHTAASSTGGGELQLYPTAVLSVPVARSRRARVAQT